MMMQQQSPPAATERYFFFDNAAPQTGKRSYPLLTAEPSSSWLPHSHHSGSAASSSSGKCEGDGTSAKHPPFATSMMISEPAYKKARVVSDDELEEPNNNSTMNLTRVKRALQQLEQNVEPMDSIGSSSRRSKRARLELAKLGPKLPPEQETRIVLRDPSIPPRDLDVQEAERAIFNSLLLQRMISNGYGRSALQKLDLVDSRLQELIRGSMRKVTTTTTTWIDEDGANTTSPSADDDDDDDDDVAMEEDTSHDGLSSTDTAMMTF